MMDQYSLKVQMVEWKIEAPGSNPTSSKLELQAFSVLPMSWHINVAWAITARNWLETARGPLNKHFASWS